MYSECDGSRLDVNLLVRQTYTTLHNYPDVLLYESKLVLCCTAVNTIILCQNIVDAKGGKCVPLREWALCVVIHLWYVQWGGRGRGGEGKGRGMAHRLGGGGAGKEVTAVCNFRVK